MYSLIISPLSIISNIAVVRIVRFMYYEFDIIKNLLALRLKEIFAE